MIKILAVFLAATLLTACSQSQDSMCSDLGDLSVKTAVKMGGASDGEAMQKMKAAWIEGCKKQPFDMVKAQHKALIK